MTTRISSNNITAGSITAGLLHDTAIQDKLGYTPFSSSGGTITGNITISGNNDLIVTGDLNVSTIIATANGTSGTDGQVLTSNGSEIYWANAASGGVTTGKAIAMSIVFGG
jgi:hypothetical protein